MINIKQLCTNQTSSRWKKVNKMRHFTVIADLNVVQKKIQQGDLSFFCLFYSSKPKNLMVLKKSMIRNYLFFIIGYINL